MQLLADAEAKEKAQERADIALVDDLLKHGLAESMSVPTHLRRM